MGRRDDEPFLWEDGGGAEGGAGAEHGAGLEHGESAGRTVRTWTIPQLAARLRGLLAQAFPEPVWLVGEVSGLARSRRAPGGHWYFALVDDASGQDEKGRARVEVILWSRTVQRLFGPRGRLPQPPDDGHVLRVLVRPNWYDPAGKLSFIIEDVDPDFTLGNLDRRRRELLARLHADGSLARNKALVLPALPLRLGLVTARESAAYNDVLSGLRAARAGFRITCCDARMQGAEAGPSVCAALATLARLGVEAILLVRGGGSRLDLAWFDREDIARAIADCPVPVLTGIGHEIDLSIADAAAHTSFKTPTAVAEHLAEAARTARRESEERLTAILAHAGEALAAEGEALLDRACRLREAPPRRLAGESAALRHASQRLVAGTGESLRGEEAGLAERSSRLRRGRHVTRLGLLAAALERDVERLAAAARSRLDAAAGGLQLAAERARLLDPRHVLARGFAWLRRADGALLKDAAAVRAGERLIAELRDGEIDVQALGTRRPPARLAPPPRREEA